MSVFVFSFCYCLGLNWWLLFIVVCFAFEYNSMSCNVLLCPFMGPLISVWYDFVAFQKDSLSQKESYRSFAFLFIGSARQLLPPGAIRIERDLGLGLGWTGLLVASGGKKQVLRACLRATWESN